MPHVEIGFFDLLFIIQVVCLFLKILMPPPIWYHTVLLLKTRGKTKQREVQLRDSNPAPENPFRYVDYLSASPPVWFNTSSATTKETKNRLKYKRILFRAGAGLEILKRSWPLSVSYPFWADSHVMGRTVRTHNISSAWWTSIDCDPARHQYSSAIILLRSD